jgi:AraC family transcriptional regulator, arabinose operon regulatory protein
MKELTAVLKIPEEYFKNDTIHRNISSDTKNGILSCGFLNKRSKNSSETNVIFEYYGALLLLSGEGIHVDNECKEYKLYPGCFIQRIPGKIHSTYVNPDGKWLEFFICFGREMFESLSNIYFLNIKQDVLYPGLNMAIFDTFVNYLNSLRIASEEDLPLLLTEAQKIIITLYQMHNKSIKKNENMEIVNQACQIISQGPYKKLSGFEVSRQLGIGYEKFRKLFKSKMGISPGEYIIHRRIDSAKTKLIDTGHSVKEVALELGFPDVFSFSKQFKKVVGIPPIEFKRIY